VILKVLPLFHYSGLATSITKSLQKIYISIFLTYKCEKHFINVFAQGKTTTPVEYNNQAENRHVYSGSMILQYTRA